MTDLNLCHEYIRLHTSAKDRGIPFDLSLCSFRNLLRRKKCPYTGEDLITHGKDNTASIDRIDNSRGYVCGNVIACSITANSLKSNMPTDMILRMAKVIKTHRSKS